MCGAFTSDSRFIAKPEALLGTISGEDDRRFPVADRCHFVPHLIASL